MNSTYCFYHVVDALRVFFFFQAEDGIRVLTVTGVQTCALPIWLRAGRVDVLHRHDLRVAAAARSSLHTEHGPERRLPDAQRGVLAEPAKRLRHEIGRASCRERV